MIGESNRLLAGAIAALLIAGGARADEQPPATGRPDAAAESGQPAAGEAAPGTTAAGTVAQLSWLAGCWESRDARDHTEEQWMAPEGRTLIGMSRTVRNGKTIAWENLRIEERDGRLIFTARPSTQPEASFSLKSLDADAAVFENEDHDYPQRVIYRRGPDATLLGRIEGIDKGKERAVDFPMRRVACPGAISAPAAPGE